MLRLYEPSKGAVKIDGVDIKSINRVHLHNNVVPVKQEPVLFSGTIWENIVYGLLLDNVTMEDVHAAAKKANVHDFVMSLPQTYDTNVGSLGVQLSGGQKQRLAIARALMRKPKILLHDEATASLDSASELIIHAALEHELRSTCVIVAHRLSTVQHADLILFLENGRIVETGCFDGERIKVADMHVERFVLCAIAISVIFWDFAVDSFAKEDGPCAYYKLKRMKRSSAGGKWWKRRAWWFKVLHPDGRVTYHRNCFFSAVQCVFPHLL